MTREEVEDLFINKNNMELKLRTKRSEKKVYELNRKGLNEIIDIKITASYNDYIKTSNISDSTSNIAVKRTEQMQEYNIKINELEKEIANLEYNINAIEEKINILSYKEKVLLKAKFVDKLQDYEIGNIVYFKHFNQTRDERTIQRIIEKALNKMKNVA